MAYLTDYQYYENGGLNPENENWGSYQYISLNDIVNNFMVMYVGNDKLINNVEIETYEDHRMAMSFAPLSILTNITIKDSDVVSKSYPNFWNDLMKIGVKINKS